MSYESQDQAYVEQVLDSDPRTLYFHNAIKGKSDDTVVLIAIGYYTRTRHMIILHGWSDWGPNSQFTTSWGTTLNWGQSW